MRYMNRCNRVNSRARAVDDIRDVDGRFEPWERAGSGVERLRAWVSFWGSYIPEIYPVGRALLAVRDTDEAAAAAWGDRMAAVRRRCADTVAALAEDGVLAPDWPEEEAVALLWSTVSLRTWEQLTCEFGWTTPQYVEAMTRLLEAALVHTPD